MPTAGIVLEESSRDSCVFPSMPYNNAESTDSLRAKCVSGCMLVLACVLQLPPTSQAVTFIITEAFVFIIFLFTLYAQDETT